MRLFWIVFLPVASYQLLALFASLRHMHRQRGTKPAYTPGVSVLKPLRGIDPNTYEAFASHVDQTYPDFEILFGAREESDPAVAKVRRLQRTFPNRAIHLVIGGESTPNGKVGVLMELAKHARCPIWVVNDSDIRVDPVYLREIVTRLADPSIGVVTCPYRVHPHNLPSAWEGLGIMTDFIPSTLVAQVIGVREFGLGSTLAFRAADLAQAGGFAKLAAFLADDYHLAKRIARLGKRTYLSTYIVETSLGHATWPGIWHHQLRWARTIRLSKGLGHAGLPITYAGLWAALAISCGLWQPAAILLALRISSAAVTGWGVLRSRFAGAFSWLSPLWDLYAFCVWLASYTGNTIRWRDQILEIDSQGRIVRASSQAQIVRESRP